MKPNIFAIEIDRKQDDIEITIHSSIGQKKVILSDNQKGCIISASDIGGLSETDSGIFLTINGQRTEKL